MELFVGNLNSSVTANDLRNHFEKFGKLTRCDVLGKGRHANDGYGFVSFENRDDAEKAMKNLQGITIKDSKINIEWARGTPKGRGRRDYSDNRRRYSPYSRGRGYSPRRRYSRDRSPRRNYSRERSPRRHYSREYSPDRRHRDRSPYYSRRRDYSPRRRDYSPRRRDYSPRRRESSRGRESPRDSPRKRENRERDERTGSRTPVHTSEKENDMDLNKNNREEESPTRDDEEKSKNDRKSRETEDSGEENNASR
jgi:RNA recognition motif-containing protein